jgi:site-specific DNA-methyltransferase (adenine-specific)
MSIIIYRQSKENMTQKKKILNTIKEKPYFIKDSFVLFHSDCLKILEQIPDNSVDMIFADPPYNFSI